MWNVMLGLLAGVVRFEAIEHLLMDRKDVDENQPSQQVKSYDTLSKIEADMISHYFFIYSRLMQSPSRSSGNFDTMGAFTKDCRTCHNSHQ